MIVTCEKCGTKFRLEDERVPAKGTKVQCSRCHTRFHVKPSSSTMPPQEEEKPDIEDTSIGAPTEEPDLSNPEFLHDHNPFDTDEPILGDEATAIGGASFEVSVDADEDGGGLGKGIDLGPDLDAFGPIEESVPVPRASESDPGPPAEELSFHSSPPPRAPKKRKRRRSSQIELEETAPRPARSDQASGAEPETTGAAGRFEMPAPARPPATLQIAALVLGLLLITGGLRALVLFGTGAPSGPLVIRGAGWTAANFQTFHARDLSGRRALVVRGRLRPDRGGGIPPVVVGKLIDSSGRAFGTEARAQPAWLPDEIFAPDRLEQYLDGGDASDLGPGLMDGFTLLFLEPSPAARRIQIELLPANGSPSS